MQKILNAIITVRTLCARREHAVATARRCTNVMDAVKTLWERRVDVVGTL